MRKAVFIIALLFGSGCIMQAQAQTQEGNASPLSVNIIPPSPTAASLGKYGDHPVNHYTGVPEISVPITTVTNKSLKLPVSLGYHAGGLRVSEEASWVGLGWSLSAGGVITRTVRGLPDEASEELPDGYRWGYNLVRDKIKEYEEGAYNSDSSQFFLRMVADGRWDTEPDEYFFNLGGKAGKIVFDSKGEPAIVPFQKLRIQYHATEQTFVITDERGVSYTFSEVEVTENTDACEMIPAPRFISSWYLTSIAAPTGERMEFAYRSGVTYMQITPSESAYQWFSGASVEGDCPPMGGLPCRQAHKIQTVRLEKITAGKTTVTFTADTKRTDLIQPSDEYRLDGIEVAYDNVPLKKYSMRYDVFGCSKLRLTQVQEYPGSVTDAVNVPPYRFEYHDPAGVPCVTSKAQDHWGYQNSNSAATLVPVGKYYNLMGKVVRLPGADRSPVLDKTKAGVLTSIVYPTGGSTTFDYELNDYGFAVKAKVEVEETRDTTHSVLATPENMQDSKSFIIDHKQDVEILYQANVAEEYGDYPGYNQYVDIRKAGVDSPLFSRSEGVGQEFIELEPGTYSMVAYSDNPYTRSTITVNYKVKTGRILKTLRTGGLRVSRILDHDGIDTENDVVKTFRYTMKDEPGRSSGVVMGVPQYDYFYTAQTLFPESECIYYVRTSTSLQLGSTKGGSVGYREVSVLRNDGAKSVYAYSSFYDYPDRVTGDSFSPPTIDDHLSRITGHPFPQPTSYDYIRGLPKLVLRSKTIGGNEVVVQKIRNSYRLDNSSNFKEIRALKAFYLTRHAQADYLNEFAVQDYQQISQWFYQDSAVVVDYDRNGENPVTSITLYHYDNPEHAQLTRTETFNSNGSKQVALTTYPSDYAAGTPFIDNMKAKHLVSLPIEQVSYAERGGDFSVLSGQVTRYQDEGKGLPSSVSILSSAAPVPLGAFKFSGRAAGTLPVAGTAAAFSPDSRYEPRLSYDIYDTSSGNLLQYRLADGMPMSYIWDYQGQYPVAEATNAISSDIAYASFEADGKGNWSYAGSAIQDDSAPTGRKVYTLSSGAISKTGLRSGTTYILSYWLKEGASVSVSGGVVGAAALIRSHGGWGLYERRVTGAGSIAVSGNGYMDELRLYPEGASVTTYTRDPAVGVTSVTDANGSSVFYKYDSLNRLHYMSDADGNVIKGYEYNYRK